jgi:hypothetical protein
MTYQEKINALPVIVRTAGTPGYDLITREAALAVAAEAEEDIVDETMPPLGHPEPHTMKWSDLELAAIHDYARAYAAQCLAAVAEDAARLDWCEMHLFDAQREPSFSVSYQNEGGGFRRAAPATTLRAAIDNARGKK